MELGTALAVVAFADQCLKYGNKFVKRCKSYLHAEEEAVELLVAIESNWLKLEVQIGVIKQISDKLDKKLQDMQSQILSQLEGKLKTASLVIEQLVAQKKEEEKKKVKINHDNERDIVTKIQDLGHLSPYRKAKYVTKKTQLFKIVDEIEKWQARYDPTWILIMQMSIGMIDKELQVEQEKHEGEEIAIITAARGIREATRINQAEKKNQEPIWIDALDLDYEMNSLPHSSVQIAIDEDTKKMVLIDTMVCNPNANLNSTTREVRDLARLLSKVDPLTFGLLKCGGVMKDPNPASSSLQPLPDFKFIFEVPRNLSRPNSLRSVLLSQTSYPLDERLDLAKKLTSSVLFVHTVSFVHKNIRPETVIVFQNEKSDIGAPFLGGFEQFRLEDGNTYRSGDDLWQHNLYRHPTRQGLHPEVDYQMQHDIYSLGVVLLEIGLWTSFILFDSDVDFDDKSEKSLPLSPIPNAILGPADPLNDRKPLRGASENKHMLERLAEKELPLRMGRLYTEIVLLCLRCLDVGTGTEKDGKGFGVSNTDWKDEDGVVIGVRFIESVLSKIQDISM